MRFTVKEIEMSAEEMRANKSIAEAFADMIISAITPRYYEDEPEEDEVGENE